MKKNLLASTILLFIFAGVFVAFKNSKDGNSTPKPQPASFKTFILPENITERDYEAGIIVAKLKPEFRSLLSVSPVQNSVVQNAFDELNVVSSTKVFPNTAQPETETNSWGAKMVDVTLIYKVKYNAATDIATAVNKLRATGVFQYAEPNYVYYTTFTPNDPSYTATGQYFLKKVKADSAWNVTQGDTNVVIGIVDSGTDPNHNDLKNNLKHNYADPVNGSDDDGDGYIDNFSGWDLSMNDNNTTVPSGNKHGSHVSGCAAATTNNSTGVASPGFNCKFLPVKCADDASTSAINMGYEGIIYAADHGCAVINCSWGGAGGGSYGQDACTYATVNKNALVVVSAGNNGDEVEQFPACYTYVLNVASTTSSDVKSGFSSYGTWVGISAPGSSIYSTYATNVYYTLSGTSMASPITAGCAALVKSMFPSYGALQIKEQLRLTADNIYPLSGNAGFQGKLGGGRVNVYRALTATGLKSIGYIGIVASDNNDDVWVVGDTLHLSGDVINYLSPSSGTTVTMSSASSYVTILNNTVNAGALGTMGVLNNSSNPFTAVIKPGTPANSTVSFTFTITDGSYTSYAYFDAIVNVDYLNITVNDIKTSVSSKSNMAYNDADLNTRAQGLGFQYRDTGMTYEIGLMIGTSSSKVSDRVRQGGTTGTVNNGFQIVSVVKRTVPSLKADFESVGQFNDASAASPLNILVTQRSYAWSATADRKFVIVEYTIKNTGVSALSNLFAGIYSDWDIGAGGATDRGAVDKTLKLGYVWQAVAGGDYAGTKLLTAGPFTHYAMNNDGNGGSIAVYTSYTNAEKFTSMSTSRDTSGSGGTGRDVGNVVSSGPLACNAGDSIVVAFALLAGPSLADLKASAVEAQIKYDIITGIADPMLSQNGFYLQPITPNPSSGITTFKFNLPTTSSAVLTLYNVAGQKIATFVNEKMQQGKHAVTADLTKYESGIYFYHLEAGDNKATGKLTLIH